MNASDALWWRNAIVYEVCLRSFQDTDGDGVGDLSGLIERLPYLNDGTPESLGVDALWLTPFCPSPHFDFGYDISDYTGVDPLYGTLEDFDRLREATRRLNVRIVMDLVVNHTSHMHRWFQESKADERSDRRDWYVWREPAAGGGPPNNWISIFGGPAWTFDEGTGQYYLHTFLPQQPDLNWRNPNVRDAVHDIVRFWTGRGVDGFRLDAIAHVAKDEQLRDNPPSGKIAAFGTSEYDLYRPRHSMNNPVLHEWLRELRVVADEDGTRRLLVSEMYNPQPQDVRLLHGSEGAEMDMTFNFDVLLSPWNATAFRQAVDSFAGNLPEGVWSNAVLGNHDQPRFASKHNWDGRGELRARLAAMILLTLRGCAFLYYGEEIGMQNVDIPANRRSDPASAWVGFKAEGAGRDPERTPMQWDASANAGFTVGDPWMPLSPDFRYCNVQAEMHDPESILRLYLRLLGTRRNSPALLEGTYYALDSVPPDTYCYVREYEGDRIVVAANFSTDTRRVCLDRAGTHARVIHSVNGNRDPLVDIHSLHLAPLEGLVLRLSEKE